MSSQAMQSLVGRWKQISSSGKQIGRDDSSSQASVDNLKSSAVAPDRYNQSNSINSDSSDDVDNDSRPIRSSLNANETKKYLSSASIGVNSATNAIPRSHRNSDYSQGSPLQQGELSLNQDSKTLYETKKNIPHPQNHPQHQPGHNTSPQNVKSLNQSSSITSILNHTTKPNSNVLANYNSNSAKQGISNVVDESVFKIFQVFRASSSNSDPHSTHTDKLMKIRNILDNLVEHVKSSEQAKFKQNNLAMHSNQHDVQTNAFSVSVNSNNSNRSPGQNFSVDFQDENQNTSNISAISKLRHTQMVHRIEANNKIISELESKLFESERAKTHLKAEKDNLLNQIAKLQRDSESMRLNREVLNIIKENHITLQKNNSLLIEELGYHQLKNQQQQKLFEMQIEEMSQMLNVLKSQLNSQALNDNQY